MARRPLQDPHIVPRPRLGHRRRGRRRHRAIKTDRAPKGADAYYRPARPRRPEPGSPLRLSGTSSSNCIHSKCPRPQQPQSTSRGQTPLNWPATQGSFVTEGPDPALPASSPERFRCPGSPRSIPFAPKREVGATTAPSAQVSVSWQSSPRPPGRSACYLGSRALGACGCLLRGVDGDKVDAFEKPNKYFSI